MHRKWNAENGIRVLRMNWRFMFYGDKARLKHQTGRPKTKTVLTTHCFSRYNFAAFKCDLDDKYPRIEIYF